MALMTPDLRTDAIAEARRLSGTRALQRDGDEGVLAGHDGVGPLIARARRSSLRRALGGRILLVWRASCEDGSGRRIESQLVALLVDVGPAPSSSEQRAWIRALLREAEAQLRRQVEAAASTWRHAAAIVSSEFTSARIQRAHAIAARLETERRQAFQPGLFDRRAERVRSADVTDAAERRQQIRARVTDAAQAAPLAARPAELLLVLTP